MAGKKKTEETVEETPVASSKTEVKVLYRDRLNGETVERVYSKAIHGDDFAKLAKQFATKFDGKIV